jgi:hypothetical protein
MEARYRTDYPGEFVILESSWRQGRKEQKREWIENPIVNQHISGRAVCIGSSINQDLFDYTRLQRHRGGLLGTLKLQTYGVGAIAEQMRLDFTVEDNPAQLKRLIENDYYQNNVVYTTARNCINHPGDFYLIPLKPRLLLPALPLYLAAFDSHKEIFLIGYNKETVYDNLAWQDHVRDVMLAYSGVKFYIVGEPTNAVDLWLDCANATTMTIRDFIGYCDV